MVTLSAKVITLATAFTALIPLPTFAAASLLRCQAKDAINLQDDGTLARDRMAEASKADSYIVDLATGMVRQIGIRPVQWIVASEGDEKNDTVLVRVTSSKSNAATDFSRADLSYAATDFIRIRQWTLGPEGSPILFVHIHIGFRHKATRYLEYG